MEARQQAAPRVAATDRDPATDAWLDACLGDIGDVIDRNLPRMTSAPLVARNVLEDVLGFTPPRQLLQTLEQMASAPESSPLRTGPGRTMVLLAILIRRELRSVTEPQRLDPRTLRRHETTLPALVRRVRALEQSLEMALSVYGLVESNRLRNLRPAILPPMRSLEGFAALVPRVRQLAEAAAGGTLDGAPGLSGKEAGWFTAATSRAPRSGALTRRVLLDAAALRVGLLEDLEAWRAAGGGREAGAVAEEVLARLQGDRAAHELMVERLEAERARAREAGDSALARRVSAAQHDLFPIYVRVATILREAGLAAETGGGSGAGARSRPAPRSWPSSPASSEPLPDVSAARTLRTAVALAVLAGVGLFLAFRDPGAPADAGAAISGARPVSADALEILSTREVAGVLEARVPGASWSALAPDERMRRVRGMTLLARERDLEGVRFLDEEGRPLAHWTPQRGMQIAQPVATPPNSSPPN